MSPSCRANAGDKKRAKQSNLPCRNSCIDVEVDLIGGMRPWIVSEPQMMRGHDDATEIIDWSIRRFVSNPPGACPLKFKFMVVNCLLHLGVARLVLQTANTKEARQAARFGATHLRTSGINPSSAANSNNRVRPLKFSSPMVSRYRQAISPQIANGQSHLCRAWRRIKRPHAPASASES